MSNLKATEYKSFEEIKHLSEDCTEFWYARELAKALEYVQWRNFAKVMERAILACKNSGYEISDHFAEVSKIVEAGGYCGYLTELCYSYKFVETFSQSFLQKETLRQCILYKSFEGKLVNY